jgi:hypothetical protein
MEQNTQIWLKKIKKREFWLPREDAERDWIREGFRRRESSRGESVRLPLLSFFIIYTGGQWMLTWRVCSRQVVTGDAFFWQLLRGVILVDERVRNEPFGPTLDFGNMLFFETRRCAWAGGWQPLLLYLCTPSIIIFYFPKFHEVTKFPSLYLNLIIFKSKKSYKYAK